MKAVDKGDQNILKEKLNDRYAILAKYMGNNRLKLNYDKTHLLIMTTRQKLININIQINTPNEEIKPIKSEKLLGIFILFNLVLSSLYFLY